jgi:hypothetical protein
MIVTSDFPGHWKTQRLIEITEDPSAPMALLWLWAYCQTCKRSHFPKMTREQLASICHWGDRKPACHTALTKSGFVDKLPNGGFMVHDWDVVNAQLIQRWVAGQKGGRPAREETVNEISESKKPADNRPITGRETDRSDGPDRSDQPDQTDLKDQTDPNEGGSKGGQDSSPEVGGGIRMEGTDASKLEQIAPGLARKLNGNVNVPTVEQVVHYARNLFNGAEAFAESFIEAKEKDNWKDGTGKPIRDWRKLFESWARTCWQNQHK